MNKLKRNGIIEKGIVFQEFFSGTEETYFEKFIDRVVENYKKSNEDKLFTAEETDAIIQALKSMPGYTPGRFYHSLRTLDEKGNITEAGLSWNLFFAYTMLSITNPELFEDYEEEADNE